MKVLFLHGSNSAVGGVKPTYLAQHGHTVLIPIIPDDDFDKAVKVALPNRNTRPRILPA
jgi:hypothetical protein